MIDIYDCELQLVTERIRSEKHPAKIIASIENDNMPKYPLLSRLTLEMSGKNIAWDNGARFLQGWYFVNSVCDQKGAVLCPVHPPIQKVDTMKTGANYIERNS